MSFEAFERRNLMDFVPLSSVGILGTNNLLFLGILAPGRSPLKRQHPGGGLHLILVCKAQGRRRAGAGCLSVFFCSYNEKSLRKVWWFHIYLFTLPSSCRLRACPMDYLECCRDLDPVSPMDDCGSGCRVSVTLGRAGLTLHRWFDVIRSVCLVR